MSKSADAPIPLFEPRDALGGAYPPLPGGTARIVAIGNFDGAHLGHAAVARAARELGSKIGGEAEIVALTFEPHPRAFFQPAQPHFRLGTPENRAAGLGRIGFDAVVVLPFTAEFAALTPEAFVSEVLAKRLGARGVVVGEDFHFGKSRAGTPEFLVESGARHGFKVALVPPFRNSEGAVIGSSAIRAALVAGEVAKANAMLGYPFAVQGEVIHGEKRGRELGYPTANIRPAPGFNLAHGIYAVRATVDGVTHPGVASYGRRPQFDNGAPLLETHLFDFKGNLYGRAMRVEFIGYIRPEATFKSLDALVARMDIDSAEARKMLKSAETSSS
jgi:riboflavin kinase/FMN adenylyltransferase